jgi:hypothetical protein
LGCAHGGGTSLGGDLEVGAVRGIVGHSSAIRITPARGSGGARNLGEVGDEGLRVSNTIVGRASWEVVSTIFYFSRRCEFEGNILFLVGSQSVKV